jgi:two-component sensor histidine kinase
MENMLEARPAEDAAESGYPRLNVTRHIGHSGDELRATRGYVRELLLGWELAPDDATAVLDVAHELVANALQHGEAPIHLSFDVTTGEVLISVHDASQREAETLSYEPGVSERGLGLHVVDQLASAWGQTPDSAGKTVWAFVPTTTF